VRPSPSHGARREIIFHQVLTDCVVAYLSIFNAYSPLLQSLFLLTTSLQRELKCCARAIIRGGPQSSAVGLDNRAADGQPHAHALRFGGKESREKMIETLRIQPRTR